MNYVNYCIVLSFLFATIKCGHAENPKLTVELMSSGFHRDLEYVVVFPDYQGKHHTFLIKQPLPASVYVSTDQLDDLKRFDKINYFIDTDFVDIEKPAEKSQPFNIHLFGDTAFLQTLSLPIHFRYHEPANRSFVSVNISYPQLFVEFDENLQMENTTKPIWMMCKDLRHRCKWSQVVFDNYSRRPMSANIPIGNAGISSTITFITISWSWAAGLFIILVIRKKHNTLKNKFKFKSK